MSNFISEINECEPFPCRADQVCLDLIGSHNCRCPPGEFDTGRCETSDAFEGRLRIINDNYTFTKELENKTSAKFTLLAKLVIAGVNDIYKNSEMAPIYKGCEVQGFRNGSVIADFVVHFNETRNTSVLQRARTVLNESLYNGSTFEGLEFDPTRTFLQDLDECQNDNTHNCHQNAMCSNTIGSFDCYCKAGFAGNGISCTDINECKNASLHSCNLATPGVTCLNTPGGFQCSCKTGFSGDGVTCNVINHCLAGTHTCHPNATCYSFPGPSFKCECKEERGFYGNGTHCFVGCPVNLCENGGTCIVSEVGNICKCPKGSYGERCEFGIEEATAAPPTSDKLFVIVVILASICGLLLLVLLVPCIWFLRRRLRENQDDLTPVEGQKYRPARESCVVKLEAVDEDFVLAHRGMRAIPLSSDSFREVASGLSAANEAMNQLSRIGRRSTKPPRGHDPTFDSLAFDDWMETIKSWEDQPSAAEC